MDDNKVTGLDGHDRRVIADIKRRVYGDGGSLVPPQLGRNFGDSALEKILVLSSISAASYSGGKLTPVTVTVRVMYEHPDNDGSWTHSSSYTLDIKSFYVTAIPITSGKARFGWAIDGELLLADCGEITL